MGPNDIKRYYGRLIYNRKTLRTYGTLLILDLLGYQHVAPMGHGCNKYFSYKFKIAQQG